MHMSKTSGYKQEQTRTSGDKHVWALSKNELIWHTSWEWNMAVALLAWSNEFEELDDASKAGRIIHASSGSSS